MRPLWLALLLLLPGAGASPAMGQTAVQSTTIVIGSGASSGTYYPVARALCRVLDRELRGERVRCSAEATAGSVYNLQRLEQGEFDFALAQADVQYAAMNGIAPWSGARFAGLRAVAPLFAESFIVVAAAPLAERGLDALRGQRLHAGAAGSGSRATWDALAEVLGWPAGSGPRMVLGPAPQESLCERRIDAMAMVAFWPSRTIERLLRECGTALIAVDGGARERLLARHPYFQATEIPALADGLPATPSFRVGTDLVTSLRTDPRVVGLVARALRQSRDELHAELPAIASADAASQTRPIAPLHPAAGP